MNTIEKISNLNLSKGGNQMKKTIKMIVMTMVAIITVSSINVVACSAASKKNYKVPSHIVTGEDISVGEMKYKGWDQAISYKGNHTTFTGGEGMIKDFTYMNNNRYNYKYKYYATTLNSATIKTKKDRVVLIKGKGDTGEKYTTKFYYKGGKLYKTVEKWTYSKKSEYKTSKIVEKIKTDKHGNLKKQIITSKSIMRDGSIDKNKEMYKYKNIYSGKYIKKAKTTRYFRIDGKWKKDTVNIVRFKYRNVRLTKSQYTRYKPIINYIMLHY